MNRQNKINVYNINFLIDMIIWPLSCLLYNKQYVFYDLANPAFKYNFLAFHLKNLRFQPLDSLQVVTLLHKCVVQCNYRYISNIILGSVDLEVRAFDLF